MRAGPKNRRKAGLTNVAKHKSLNRTGTRSSRLGTGRVYLVWHTDRFGDEKLIGVYDRKSEASAAIERVKRRPGFSDRGGAFKIACYPINKDHWTRGFVRRGGSSLPEWFRPG